MILAAFNSEAPNLLADLCHVPCLPLWGGGSGGSVSPQILWVQPRALLEAEGLCALEDLW